MLGLTCRQFSSFAKQADSTPDKNAIDFMTFYYWKHNTRRENRIGFQISILLWLSANQKGIQTTMGILKNYHFRWNGQVIFQAMFL